MRFHYNKKKAAQAAAHLVHLHNGELDVMALLKLLYLADRKSLIESGYPITGDEMVSMPHGPVLSRIYDSIKWGKHDEGNPWYAYLSERENNRVSLTVDCPEQDELSEYDLEVLNEINREYGHLTPWQLRELTHRLPEYEDPNGSSYPIDPTEILRSVGKSDHDIEVCTREAEEAYLVGRLIMSGSAG